MRLDKVLYTAHATTTGGRTGTSVTNDGALKLEMSTPRELGGAGGPGTNPEQLFAAGYSACFSVAMPASCRATQSRRRCTALTNSAPNEPIPAASTGVMKL